MSIRAPLRPQVLNRHFANEVASRACPPEVAPNCFERARLGAQRFAMNWAEIAISKGWASDELFNCPEPFAETCPAIGAAWRVNDAVVLAVETDAILIQTPTGSRQRIYRRSG
jgi:hypothetical protein